MELTPISSEGATSLDSNVELNFQMRRPERRFSEPIPRVNSELSLEDALPDDDAATSDSDGIPPLELDLDEMKRAASIALGSPCTCVKKLCNGAYHEVYVLHFEPSQCIRKHAVPRPPESCIARFARDPEPLDCARSTLATMQYVRDHSDIPVPKLFYSDLNPANAVGAPYVLMEKLVGEPLYRKWENLELTAKKSVVEQVAGVPGELAKLNFDEIGSLQDQKIGPLYPMCWEGPPRGPFKTAEDYLLSFIDDQTVLDQELKSQYQEIRSIVLPAASSSLFQPPFPLIHADFNVQNLLFTLLNDGSVPVPTGVID